MRDRSGEMASAVPESNALAGSRLVPQLAMMLRAPRWVLTDEVLESLEAETRTRVRDVFGREVKDAAIIYIGRNEASDPAFSRVLHLIKEPTVRRLVRHQASDERPPEPGIRAVLRP